MTLCFVIALPLPVLAAPGDVLQTPTTPMELPIEVEIELSPAGSLKQAALWKELVQLLYNPHAVTCTDPNDYTTCTSTIDRRPGFGATMPPLNVYPLGYNFLTGQPMRLRTSDGEISWDNPGPLFDPDEIVATDAFNTPTELRTIIGHLVACPDVPPGYQAAILPEGFCNGKPDGSMVIYNPGSHPAIPPDGTVVAVSAFVNGILQELNGVTTTSTVGIEDLEIPVNEEDFLAGGTPAEKQTARASAEILGKALFWDMQVGSDGVQACGSCHFHAGVDNRTRGQLNPGTNAGDLTLQVAGPNENVEPGDFPFHKLIADEPAVEETNCGFPGQPDCVDLIHDANDVMSSMGVSRFKIFEDIPPIGTFIDPGNEVLVLPPDLGTVATDPVPVNEGLRRVEPRHTPTFHGAAFNLDNFWDGRARFDFNGGSVHGAADPYFHVFIDDGALTGATMGHFRDEIAEEDPEMAEQPVRAKFSSLASQAVGPPLSDFEMSFSGRNWPKIGKKLLQSGVTPLANQLVSTTDSVLGPYSNQHIAPGMPGLSISYPELIQLAFRDDLWQNTSEHLAGSFDPSDPFDNYVLEVAPGPADPANTNQFTQMEANFSSFFGFAVQMYEALVIPDDTPADRFFDVNPNAGHAVGEPGDQAVLFPTLIPDLLNDGVLNNNAVYPTDGSTIQLVEGFGPDELFGFDLFAGGNLTAALPVGSPRNPNGFGSNPFTRSAKCMLCHLGPEQTDHSINISHGLLKNNAEFEYPTPPFATDPGAPNNCFFEDCLLPAPEPSGSSRTVAGLILSEEVSEGPPQDAVEVEPRNFASADNPATPWDDAVVAQAENFAFGDQGIYNIGLRPSDEDISRGGDDPFGWPLSLAALTLKNIGGQNFEPNDDPTENNVMANFDPVNLGLTFEETGDDLPYPGAPGHTLQSVNPGFDRGPIAPQMPAYMAPWINDLPAGELHPQIDEMAGMVPNTLTPPNGGPGIEFPEILFGADLHCAFYDPEQFGNGPPNFGWGAPLQDGLGEPSVCPQNQSGVAGNFEFPVHGTWPVPNRVLRDGAFKAPSLRNVELTGPYFHTGSYLTLRQVVDFYFRGGDFPMTNAANRDPHIVDLDDQAFAFGRTTGADLLNQVNFVFSEDPPFTLEGTFADGLPDTAFLYDAYPDSDHPNTPEPAFASREAAMEDAKNALVKFLLALTDARVKFERAPFDRPEIFVPVDGAAPENTAGRDALLADPGFLHVAAVGAAGNPDPLPNFLGVSSVMGDPGNDHFDAVTVTPPPPIQLIQMIGTYRNGTWYLDDGNGAWDPGIDTIAGNFGLPTDIPVTGDWNGDGTSQFGAFRNGTWYLDNGNGMWDAGIDGVASFGQAGDLPTPGDWNGDGTDQIGVYRNGTWYFDANGNGTWDAGIDLVASFGLSTDIPVTGDWNGDSTNQIGVYRDGTWYFDANGNGAWDAGIDLVGSFGQAGDRPVTGDWNGDGTTQIGVYRNGTWYLDANGNAAWDAGIDLVVSFGLPTDIPVTGSW